MSEKNILKKNPKKTRLNYLQTNNIAIRRNVTSGFRKHFCYVIVLVKRLCELNTRECDIKEDFNQNGSLIIS